MKRLFCVIPLVCLLCFAFGCQDKAAMEELEKFKAQAAVEEQNKELVKTAWEAYRKGDFEAFREFLAPEYVYYSPSNSSKPITSGEVIEQAKMIRAALPDITISLEEIIAEGDRVISRYIMRGTHQGEFAGIPATGNKIECSGIMITRIENGKDVEDRDDYDALGFMQQLGMELKPKEEKK